MLLCCLWHNDETSCHTLHRHLPLSTNTAAYKRIVSSTCHGPSQLSVLHLAFTASDGARHWLRIAISAYPTCIWCPVERAGPSRNIAMTFGMEKLEWYGENFLKICLFISTESTNVTDWQTHRWTPYDGTGYAYIASRGKNKNYSTQAYLSETKYGEKYSSQSCKKQNKTAELSMVYLSFTWSFTWSATSSSDNEWW